MFIFYDMFLVVHNLSFKGVFYLKALSQPFLYLCCKIFKISDKLPFIIQKCLRCW